LKRYETSLAGVVVDACARWMCVRISTGGAAAHAAPHRYACCANDTRNAFCDARFANTNIWFDRYAILARPDGRFGHDIHCRAAATGTTACDGLAGYLFPCPRRPNILPPFVWAAKHCTLQRSFGVGGDARSRAAYRGDLVVQ
jgi:hypothetical protein